MSNTPKTITPELLRQAAKDLSLTVTAIAEGTGLSKAYISEFRNETRNLTATQQAQLLAFIEQKYQEAGKDFPEVEDTSAQDLIKGLGGIVKNISRPAILLSEDIPKAQVNKLLDLIESNRLKVAELLEKEFKTAGMFSSGPSASTEDDIREVFGLLALNYVAVLMLQGRNIARQVPKDFNPKTISEWLSTHFTTTSIGSLLPSGEVFDAEKEGV